MQYHQLHFTMILMIYINGSNIFMLIYPCYISILLYRLYSTILCILLSCCFIYVLVSLYLLMYSDDTQARTYILYTFAYLIYAFIWHLLSALHAFIAPMLLYFYMIHIAFVSWPGFSAFLCHTRMKAHTHIYYIVFIYAFMSHDGTIFLIYYTNFLIVFVLSRDIFYLCSIYTAKIIKFVQ